MTYNWNEEKNEELRNKRNISFEEIILCISEGKIIKILEHPNKDKYPNQFMYLIEYNDYIYVVPFVNNEKEKEIFLKTIFQSRFYTKKFGKGEKNEK